MGDVISEFETKKAAKRRKPIVQGLERYCLDADESPSDGEGEASDLPVVPQNVLEMLESELWTWMMTAYNRTYGPLVFTGTATIHRTFTMSTGAWW
jgi:hypothetical protein